MPSITPNLYTELQETLLRCAPFESDKELKAIFVDGRIAPWASLVPQATSARERVQATIDRLGRQTRQDTDQNGLVLLLQVLRDTVPVEDSLHGALDSLAERLTAEFTAQGTLARVISSPPPHDENLSRLADFMQTYWVEQFLDNALLKAIYIDLGLEHHHARRWRWWLQGARATLPLT